jgi:hypothetical protein
MISEFEQIKEEITKLWNFIELTSHQVAGIKEQIKILTKHIK